MARLSGKLLLYEDLDDNICKMLAPAFQKMGLHTRAVSDLEECFKAVRKEPPDVVFIITNNIREQGAFKAAEAIRALYPRCGFVFMAGCDTDGRERFLAAGYRFRVHDLPAAAKELTRLISEAITSPMETFVIPKSTRAAQPCGFGQDAWLDPTMPHGERVQAILRPFEAEVLSMYPVGTPINSVDNENLGGVVYSVDLGFSVTLSHTR